MTHLVDITSEGLHGSFSDMNSSAKVPLEKKPVDYGQDGEDRRSK